jgi:hypothetical protein
MSRATIVDIGRDGPTSVRLHTEPGDNNVAGSGNGGERNDISLGQSATNCYESREQMWEHSILFPDDFNSPVSGWFVVFDFHNTGSTGQANFHVDAGPNGLAFRGYGGVLVDPSSPPGIFVAAIGPVVRNQWYDFVYHVKWSSGSDGFFKAWVNGVQILAHSGPTLYQGQGCYLKLANYHMAFGQPTSVIHDRVIRYDIGP